MPFVTIKGSFHLCGQSAAGNPTGFQPDGDSMQFKPDQPKLLDRLERTADAYRLTSIGSTQLRFEGIDALELHFEGHHQPRQCAHLPHWRTTPFANSSCCWGPAEAACVRG